MVKNFKAILRFPKMHNYKYVGFSAKSKTNNTVIHSIIAAVKLTETIRFDSEKKFFGTTALQQYLRVYIK